MQEEQLLAKILEHVARWRMKDAGTDNVAEEELLQAN